jgi:hypothetical protein
VPLELEKKPVNEEESKASEVFDPDDILLLNTSNVFSLLDSEVSNVLILFVVAVDTVLLP